MASTGRTAAAPIWALTSFTLSVVVACAHAPDLPLRPDPAHATEPFVARDGTKLLAYHWPATGTVKGAFVIVHGLKDYAARYDVLAKRAAADGFDVWAFDLRGHGHSEGPRVAPDDWEDYVDDEARFLTLVESRDPGKPVFLFGHSMGGAIATRTAEVHRPKIAGLVLSGAALAIDAPPMLVALTRMTGFLMPSAPALKLDNADFSSDPANEAAMDRDPLIEQGAGPAKTAAGLVEGMHEIWRDVGQLTMPILAMHGTADQLTAPFGSWMLVVRSPKWSWFKPWPDYAHDLLHEPNGRGDQVAATIVQWLDDRLDPKQPISASYRMTAPFREPLPGRPLGWTQAFEGAVGIAHEDARDRVASEVALQLARPHPGFYGSLTAERDAKSYMLALRPLGLAFRSHYWLVGMSIGGAIVGPRQVATTHYDRDYVFDIGAGVEGPAGPLHLAAHYDIPLDGRVAMFATIRFGGDRRYWPVVRAGVGPSITAGLVCDHAGDTRICNYSALLGLQLYGAD